MPFESTITIRRAGTQDAAGIAACYTSSYAPQKAEDPSRHYPFPQFMDPAWIADRVREERFVWYVAECEGEIAGTFCGRDLEVGRRGSLAEIHGLAVACHWRRQRIATRLLQAVDAEFKDCDVLLGETRTATRVGWHLLRREGFNPLGFEPFAHRTPAGSEAMLMHARLSPGALKSRSEVGTSSIAVSQLANLVLAPLGLPPLPGASPAGYSTRRDKLERISISASGERTESGTAPVATGSPGIARLPRLRGIDPGSSRFYEHKFAGFIGRRLVAIARVHGDKVDRRAKIDSLETSDDELQGPMLATITIWLQEHRREPLSIVVNARADRAELHSTLESLGYFPTVYYPSLLGSDRDRFDVVQFTKLIGYEPASAIDTEIKADFDWKEAAGIVDLVGKLNCSTPITTRTRTHRPTSY